MSRAKGLIRKISVGDLKDGITYVVGQSMMNGRLIIAQIIKDVDVLHSKYDIFVREPNSDILRLWKEIEMMPVGLEYDITVVTDEI